MFPERLRSGVGQVMDDVRLQETNGSDAQNGDKKQCHKTMDPGKSGLQRKADRKDILYFAWKYIRGHKGGNRADPSCRRRWLP